MNKPARSVEATAVMLGEIARSFGAVPSASHRHGIVRMSINRTALDEVEATFRYHQEGWGADFPVTVYARPRLATEAKVSEHTYYFEIEVNHGASSKSAISAMAFACAMRSAAEAACAMEAAVRGMFFQYEEDVTKENP